MKILRIEDAKGKGLYHGLHEKLELVKFGDIPRYQPIPAEDGIKLNDNQLKTWKFAFRDPEQFVSWFRDFDILEIVCQGGIIVEYEVYDRGIRQGKRQLAFNPKDIRDRRVLELDEIINRFDKADRRWQRVQGYI